MKDLAVEHPLDRYIRNVLSGNEIVGEYIYMAVRRHVEDLNKENFAYVFVQEKADIVIDFCQMCRHWKGTFAKERICLEDWQVFLTSMIYGWRRKDGTKRFREVYIDLARKQAKTTLLSLFALFEITLSGVEGAQVYCGATKEDQAILLVNDAGKIAEKTPELAQRLVSYKYKNQIKRVVNLATASYIAPLGRDSSSQDGFDPSMGIMDEYHAHKTDEVKNVIDSGMGARLDPLMLHITTAGFNKNGPCFKFRKHAIEVLAKNKKDETLFIAIFAMDEGDDWRDSKCWVKANPLKTTNFEYLQDRCLKAVNEGGTKEVDFKTKNLNMWVDSSDSFIKEESLLAVMKQLTIDDFKGVPSYGGLDLGVTKDFSAFSVACEIDEKILIKTWLWLTQKRYDDLKIDNAEIVDWKKNGYVIVTPGNAADHNALSEFIAMGGKSCIMEQLQVKLIAFDRFNSIGIINMMERESVPMFAMGQGFVSMNPPICELERRIADDNIIIDENPAIVWMYRSLTVLRDTSGNRKFDKSDPELHIDGPVSQAMAIGALLSDKLDRESKYNEEELLIL